MSEVENTPALWASSSWRWTLSAWRQLVLGTCGATAEFGETFLRSLSIGEKLFSFLNGAFRRTLYFLSDGGAPNVAGPGITYPPPASTSHLSSTLDGPRCSFCRKTVALADSGAVASFKRFLWGEGLAVFFFLLPLEISP